MVFTHGCGVNMMVDPTGDPTGEVAQQAVALAAKGAFLNPNGLGQSVAINDIKQRYLAVSVPCSDSYDSIQIALRV